MRATITKPALAALLFFTLPGLSFGASDQDVVTACTALVHEYAYHRDRWDADSYANTFTEDGEVVFPDGRTFKGRETLRQRMRDDGGKTVSRHLMTTVNIFPGRDNGEHNTATGLSYLLVFQEPAPQTPAVLTANSYIVGEYHDEFVIDDTGCKFARRTIKFVFKSAAAPKQ